MNFLNLEQIKNRIDLKEIIKMQEDGFKYFSLGKVNTPPVGYLEQYDPDGSYHIKYGLIKNDDVWVVKIAGGPDKLPMSGIMIVISTKTGKPEAILQDDGYLTQLRTAVGGYICAKILAPRVIEGIGVLGAGEQARMQVSILKGITKCRNLYIWARNINKAKDYKIDMEKEGFSVTIVEDKSKLAKNCNLIITTTMASEPLLNLSDIARGTHITAVGADAPGKFELDPNIIKQADIVVADSKEQCIDHGEIARAYNEKLISDIDIIEIGDIISGKSSGRENDDQITISDLTGIAVQDIQIAKAIMNKVLS